VGNLVMLWAIVRNQRCASSVIFRGITWHHMSACPKWNSPHPMAAYMGSAGLGLGFYHIDTPKVENTQWLNLKNCGVVRILEGEVTLAELEKELSEIFCKEWPWQIRELDVGRFLV